MKRCKILAILLILINPNKVIYSNCVYDLYSIYNIKKEYVKLILQQYD